MHLAIIPNCEISKNMIVNVNELTVLVCWKRDFAIHKIDYLANLLRELTDIRINICGDLKAIPIGIKKDLVYIAKQSRDNCKRVLNVLINYDHMTDIKSVSAPSIPLRSAILIKQASQNTLTPKTNKLMKEASLSEEYLNKRLENIEIEKSVATIIKDMSIKTNIDEVIYTEDFDKTAFLPFQTVNAKWTHVDDIVEYCNHNALRYI